MTALPPVRYARAGDIDIAYRVLGEGPPDLVWVPGLFSNLETDWEDQFLQRGLASFSRLIGFDKRGMGLSGRNVGAPTLEERMDDVDAVMDAVGSERAALLGVSGEILVSRTVTDLVIGSGITFEDRGDHELKGVPGTWPLFAVSA